MGRRASDISIYTIAAELGVSASTVSRVFNNKTGVSEDTRLRVAEVLRKNKFKPNYPRQQKQKIAIIIPSSQGVDPYSARVLTGIYGYLNQCDIIAATLTCNPEEKGTILQIVREQQCSGIIVMLPEPFMPQMPELERSKLPIMLIDSQSTSPQIGFVDNDACSAGMTITRHLLELGHRKIGFITRWEENLNHIQRYSGYRNAMLEAGIEPRPEWFRTWRHGGDYTVGESGSILFREIIAENPDLTALIAVNEELALGAMHEAIASGFKVPEDLSVAGFDTSVYSTYTTPSLTSVSHPAQEAGQKAAEAIVAFLKGETAGRLVREILPTHLIPGTSTGPVPKHR